MITLLLLVRATYLHGVILHAHPFRGESHIQRNTCGDVATSENASDLSACVVAVVASEWFAKHTC